MNAIAKPDVQVAPINWQKISEDRWIYLLHGVARAQVVNHGAAFVVRLYRGRNLRNMDVWLDGDAYPTFAKAVGAAEHACCGEPWNGQIVQDAAR